MTRKIRPDSRQLLGQQISSGALSRYASGSDPGKPGAAGGITTFCRTLLPQRVSTSACMERVAEPGVMPMPAMLKARPAMRPCCRACRAVVPNFIPIKRVRVTALVSVFRTLRYPETTHDSSTYWEACSDLNYEETSVAAPAGLHARPPTTARLAGCVVSGPPSCCPKPRARRWKRSNSISPALPCPGADSPCSRAARLPQAGRFRSCLVLGTAA